MKNLWLNLLVILSLFMLCAMAESIVLPTPLGITAAGVVGVFLFLMRDSVLLSAVTFGLGARLFRPLTECRLAYVLLFSGALAGVAHFLWYINFVGSWVNPVGYVWEFLFSLIGFSAGAAIWTLIALKLQSKSKYLKWVTVYIPVAAFVYVAYRIVSYL